MKFRKKVAVDATQWFKHGDHPAVQRYSDSALDVSPAYEKCGWIQTLESGPTMHHVIPGDWIIKGVKGEFYPIKDQIFRETYEPVEATYLRAGQDVCANCGKYYDEHLLWDGNKCELSSINGWFPKRLADVFTKSMKITPKDRP